MASANGRFARELGRTRHGVANIAMELRECFRNCSVLRPAAFRPRFGPSDHDKSSDDALDCPSARGLWGGALRNARMSVTLLTFAATVQLFRGDG
jgi:hypothetical protein